MSKIYVEKCEHSDRLWCDTPDVFEACGDPLCETCKDDKPAFDIFVPESDLTKERARFCRWTREITEDGTYFTRTECGHGGEWLLRWVVAKNDFCRKCGGRVEVISEARGEG